MTVLLDSGPAEAVESVRLINDKEAFAKYYNPERMTLEHYKFSALFIRSTKKVYLNFVMPDMLETVVKKSGSEQNDSIPSYNAIRLACRKRGINIDMRFYRKIYGSWLHQNDDVT